MAVREIRIYGDPVLRTVCDPIAAFDDHTRSLADDLLDSVGLPGRAGVAAPQIGVALRAFSYNTEGQRGVVFNPTLVETKGEELDDEGCLSVPGLWFPTMRAAFAKVRGFDADGNAIEVDGEGEIARCLQHEVDHLDGVVYIQRLEPSTRRGAMREIRRAGWFS